MKLKLKHGFLFFGILIINLQLAKAQSIQEDTTKNEGISNSGKKNPFPSLKNIAIGKMVKLNIGGQLREYYQFYNNEKWGNVPASFIDKNGFFWHRIVLSTDWKFGKKVNLLAEFNSSFTSSRAGGNRPSVDYNELDISQLYLLAAIWKNSKSNLKIRVGRQMYPFGSQRLITTREGPNNRLSFEGATVIYKTKNFTLTSFIAQPIYNKFYVFDDSVVHSQTIWGVNLNQLQMGKAGKLELYYYGYSNSKIRLAGKYGKDIRHSVGLFYTYQKGGWMLEAEPVFQLGKFGNQAIFAYGLFGKMEKRIISGKIRIAPYFSLGIFSGDHNSSDGTSNTYNPMYPKPPFGLIAPLGPVNLLVAGPGIKISLLDKWQFSLSSNIYWRESSADGLYTPAVNPAIQQIFPIDKPNAIYSKFVGQDFIININYKINNYLSMGFEGGYFKAGDYIKQTGKGKNITYLSGKINFKF